MHTHGDILYSICGTLIYLSLAFMLINQNFVFNVSELFNFDFMGHLNTPIGPYIILLFIWSKHYLISCMRNYILFGSKWSNYRYSVVFIFFRKFPLPFQFHYIFMSLFQYFRKMSLSLMADKSLLLKKYPPNLPNQKQLDTAITSHLVFLATINNGMIIGSRFESWTRAA